MSKAEINDKYRFNSSLGRYFRKEAGDRYMNDWMEISKNNVIALVEKRKDRSPWYIKANEIYRCLVFRKDGKIYLTVDEFKERDNCYLCCSFYTSLLCKTMEEYNSLTETQFVRAAYNTWMTGAR